MSQKVSCQALNAGATRKSYDVVATASSDGTISAVVTGLTANSDGSYTPSENSNARVYNVSGGLLVGSAYLNLNGTNGGKN